MTPVRALAPALLTLVLCLGLMAGIFAQPVIAFQPRRATPAELQVLDTRFSAYSLYQLDTRSVSDLLRAAPAYDEIRIEAGGEVFRFALRARDIRDAA